MSQRKVCIVTGATRGIGKGIALVLAETGATIYITGRTLEPVQGSSVGGSLMETAAEAEARGGKCIPVQCDHSKDEDVAKLFQKVQREHNGQLDILVNNAYSGVDAVFNNSNFKFWEQPMSMWDDVNNVGLRNHYMCAIYASRMMVPSRRGLIVNISSVGALRYLFTPTYGIGKEACDRMAADCAVELRDSNVAFVSLWPGAVNTEKVSSYLDSKDFGMDTEKNRRAKERAKKMFAAGEDQYLAGQCVVALASDPQIMKKSGKILMTGDLMEEYGLKPRNGQDPMQMRRVNYLLKMAGWQRLAYCVPNFVKIPKWLLAVAGSKF